MPPYRRAVAGPVNVTLLSAIVHPSTTVTDPDAVMATLFVGNVSVGPLEKSNCGLGTVFANGNTVWLHVEYASTEEDSDTARTDASIVC